MDASVIRTIDKLHRTPGFLEGFDERNSSAAAAVYVRWKLGTHNFTDDEIRDIVIHFNNRNQPKPKTKKETIMPQETNAPAVEIVTRIYGQDAKHVSDAEVFDMIAKLEGDIKSLNAIEHKPNKLVAQIAKLQDEIKALVAVVDGRE